LQVLSGAEGFFVLPEDYRHNLAHTSGDIKAFGKQSIAEMLRARLQFLALLVHPTREVQSC